MRTELAALQETTARSGFWDNQATAQKILKKISGREKEIAMWERLGNLHDEAQLHLELLLEEQGTEVDSEAGEALASYIAALDAAEVQHLLSGPDDNKDAILTIHPGAGGTESQD